MNHSTLSDHLHKDGRNFAAVGIDGQSLLWPDAATFLSPKVGYLPPGAAKVMTKGHKINKLRVTATAGTDGHSIHTLSW